APDVEGALAPCLRAHASASLASDPDALEGAVTSFEQLGALLLAAEAASEAHQLFIGQGQTSRAERALARARVLAAACDGARGPMTLDLDQPRTLTAREWEIVRLAATGLHSNEIAERLFVSTRTVDGHLHRAYVKLGVTSRKDLAWVLDATNPGHDD